MSKRIQVFMTDCILNKVDIMAKEIGVSRSAFCAMAVAEYVKRKENDIVTSKLQDDKEK